MKTERTAIVLGGGIAGPAAALFLERANVKVRVYEAYPHATNIGGAFQIAPNGMRVLDALGLGDAVARSGVEMGNFTFLNQRGKEIGTMKTAHAGRAVALTRDAFTNALFGAGIEVQYRKRAVEIGSVGREAVVRFEDGSTDVADFVVAADGVRSFTRGALFPEHAAPRWTGVLSMGGFVKQGFAPESALDSTRVNFMMGHRFQFGYCMFAPGRWGWWTHLPSEHEPSRAEMKAFDRAWVLMQARAAFAGWADPVERFLENTERTVCTPIHDVPSLPSWHRGRVLLIGDAAHAMSPAGGQGASLALEDAYCLGKILEDESLPIEGAFCRFESIRRHRAERVVKTARDNDERALRPIGSTGVWVRDRVFPLMAPLLARAMVNHYRAPLGV